MAPSDEVAPPFLRLAAHPLRWRLLSELGGSDLRVRELVDRTGQPQNLVSYHLRLLRDGGLVTARRSSFDGRDAYYHLDLDACARGLTGAGEALHPALRLDPPRPHGPAPVVLFACTGNSARSPMAEALLRHRTAGRIEVRSAGSHPQPAIHPHAVRAIRQHHGADLTGYRPRDLDTVRGHRFDVVISLCDKVRGHLPGAPRLMHWSIPDPAAAGYPAFADTVAELDLRIGRLLPALAQPIQEARP